MTILELMVVTATISLLMSILLPAVQVARESARNLQCTHHLQQLGSALHIFHDAHHKLPPGWQQEASKESSYGWGVRILPGLEESSMEAQIDRRRPIGAASEAVRTFSPDPFICPSDFGEPTFPLYAEEGEHGSSMQQSTHMLMSLPRANYIGVFGTKDPDAVAGESGDGCFVMSRGHRYSELSSGLSHVLLVGERTTRKLASTWLGVATEGEDAAGRLVGYAFLGPNRADADECEFDSRHQGHTNFVWADGHVAGVYDEIDTQVYRHAATR